MTEIKYKIEFFSNWHCGSGLAAGADVDALVVKDKDNLPFVPGKTIKGLVREAVESIQEFKQDNKTEKIKEAFGFFDDKDNTNKGCMFFTNAELEENERKAIISNNLQKYLYIPVSQTAIDDNGIACEHSLRKLETVVPCILEGKVKDVSEDLMQDIIDALKFIKRLGINRNRGLGRCSIKVEERK